MCNDNILYFKDMNFPNVNFLNYLNGTDLNPVMGTLLINMQFFGVFLSLFAFPSLPPDSPVLVIRQKSLKSPRGSKNSSNWDALRRRGF